MLKQMKSNLGKDISQYVEDVRLKLKTAEPQKSRRMIYHV